MAEKPSPIWFFFGYYTAIREIRNGAAQSVMIAARIIDTLWIVPDTELSSNAFDVPAPWALVPSSTPLGDFIINPEVANDHRSDH